MPAYLDYDHFQYYHQKLKTEFNSIALSESDIDYAFENNETLIDRTLTVTGSQRLNIQMGDYYSDSGSSARSIVKWTRNNLTIQSNTEYVFENAVTIKPTYTDHYTDTLIQGLKIELSCTDDQNVPQYYSTIGKYPERISTSFTRSEYEIWNAATAYEERYGYFNSDYWNYIDFNLPTGSSDTYYLRYSAGAGNVGNNAPLDEEEGIFIESNEFQVTLIHTTSDYFSVILYWKCVE